MSKPTETTIILDDEIIYMSPFLLQRDVVVKIQIYSNAKDEGMFHILGVYTKCCNQFFILFEKLIPKLFEIYSYLSFHIQWQSHSKPFPLRNTMQ